MTVQFEIHLDSDRVAHCRQVLALDAVQVLADLDAWLSGEDG